MNRTLRRPMFRIGGSAGTGITSGLDQPRKQYQEGTPNPYASNLMPGTLPGFLTSFGLDLLSRPPQGGFFQTVAASAKEPFQTFQAAEMARAQQQGEKDFLRGETDRKIAAKAEETDKLIASREKIAGMTKGDENVMAYAEVFADNNGSPNLIKGQNAVDFFDFKYNELKAEFGEFSVSVPADSSDIDTSGDDMPTPNNLTDYQKQVVENVEKNLKQKEKERKEKVLESIPDTSTFDESFYE